MPEAKDSSASGKRSVWPAFELWAGQPIYAVDPVVFPSPACSSSLMVYDGFELNEIQKCESVELL